MIHSKNVYLYIDGRRMDYITEFNISIETGGYCEVQMTMLVQDYQLKIQNDKHHFYIGTGSKDNDRELILMMKELGIFDLPAVKAVIRLAGREKEFAERLDKV